MPAGRHENSLKNLKKNPKPFQKGKSGNPGGRPKRPITQAYLAFARARCPKKVREALGLGPKATWSEAIAYGQFFNAAKGKHSNAQEIREAIEGKATQRIELSGVDDAPAIEVVHRVDLGKLSDEQLTAYRAIIKAAG
jgi:hypothetical protein